MKKVLMLLISLSLLLPVSSFAVSQEDLLNKIESLSKELDKMKQQLNDIKGKEVQKEERISRVEEKAEQASGPSWLEIGGDYRFRFDSLRGTVHEYYRFQDVLAWQMGGMTGPMPALQQGYDVKNDSLLTNRFGLNLKVNAAEDIQVKARLLMYKVWGHQTETPIIGPYFADRAGIFDGVIGHVPGDNALRVDQAYATWSNIGGAPVWFSIGRRPSTGGLPSNLRANSEKIGTAGIPSIMVDYAFDGLTLGVAPDIASLPGAYAKLCYGRGFDSGFQTTNTIKDTDFLGINVVPYDTPDLHVELQWQKGWNIFDVPSDGLPGFGSAVSTNLGDITWVGGVVGGKLDNLGVGDLNLFASAAMSRTDPNSNLYTPPGAPMGVAGLLYDAPAMGGTKESHSGSAIYLGGRYDIKSSGTKLGLEYNHGTQYWIGMVPGSDDLWTSKLGTRGDVYEVYLIQEINKKPIAKRGKAFVRLGYQHYKFNYTGSNSWIGAPKSISDLNNPANAQMLPPLDKANDVYATFEVTF